jgi:hypothetical protein
MLLKLLIPAYILANVLVIWGVKSVLQKRLKNKTAIWLYSISLSFCLTFMLALGVVVYLLQHLH